MDDLIVALSKPPAKNPCRFALWLNKLSDIEKESVLTALYDSEWSVVQLTRTLRQYGLTSAKDVVAKHRRKECSICGPN